MTYPLRRTRSAVCGLAATLLLPLALAACGSDAQTSAQVRGAGDDDDPFDVGDDTELDVDDDTPGTSTTRDAGRGTRPSSGSGADAGNDGDDAPGDDTPGSNDPGNGPAEPGDPSDLSGFKDPGKSPWVVVPEGEVAEKCKMDIAKLKSLRLGSGFAVSRYGQLCYQSGPDGASAMWSSTKTLGATVTGIASYETRNIQRSGARTGQLKDSDKATHWLGSVSYNREAHLAHVLSMVGHNANLADGSKRHSYDTVGSVQINSLSTMVRTAIAQDGPRLGTSTGAFARTFLFNKLGMTGSSWGGTQYATSWNATLGDMLRLGVLIIHQGVWSGERVLGADWAYKQVHPAFEDGNTAYGYLTWLVAREGQRSIGGGSFTSNGSSAGGLLADACSPPALWQRYPHGLSTYKDCSYKTASCKQKYDIGVWSAQGLGGQFIVGHPGLDLVIAAKNYSGGTGPAGLFNAIRPAIVALDPMYKGDDAGFCKAYAAGEYAPDLVAQPTQPDE
ncbi:MAG: hypothetical protein ABW252_21985 [Polyangiales bacterium]